MPRRGYNVFLLLSEKYAKARKAIYPIYFIDLFRFASEAAGTEKRALIMFKP